MKKILAILLAFGLATLLTACGGSPKSIAEDFYKNVAAGKTKEAVALMNPRTVGLLGEPKISAMLGEVSKKYAAAGGIDKIEFSDEKEEGDSYSASVTIHLKNGETQPDHVEMSKVDGKWYLGK
jgi:hypothetical protein